MLDTQTICPQALCRTLKGGTSTLLAREWIIANGRGGFASASVLGCPTRRYHALLTVARRPPLERFVALSGTIDELTVADRQYDLTTLEAPDGRLREGFNHLRDFDYSNSRPNPWVQWTFRTPECDVFKRITLLSGAEAVSIRYQVSCTGDYPINLQITPLVALRDFHGLRDDGRTDWECQAEGSQLWLAHQQTPDLTLALFPINVSKDTDVQFQALDSQAEQVRYRAETAQGYDDRESLQRVGVWSASGQGRMTVELAAYALAPDFKRAQKAFRRALEASAEGTPAETDGLPRERMRLNQAADQFVVRRATGNRRDQATILAGYHWFGDWGRDAFIATEGLLLCTKRFRDAREVLKTFAGAQRNGLIPNLFDDYGGQCHYNSADASLWYIHAADRYLELSGDQSAWSEFLSKACAQVVEAYVAGTDYNITTDDAGLLCCGHEQVQVTWMDAKCGDTVFTPRHGRPVEINALWYHALCILANRFRAKQRKLAKRCQQLADAVADSFPRAFVREDGLGLYDCVRDDAADVSIRPNQIFAVSLPHSPLSADQQRVVLDVVTDRLLTPYGLRSLAADDPAYRGRYGGERYDRDNAYHQGTVWSWLIGPYLEVYLRVHSFSDAAKDHARGLMQPLLDHLDEAGLGTISEIFEGDPPHEPRGCIAQAWSVAELIRVFDLID